MSKVICDVCGTSFPDTVNQCPICGCARADISDPTPQNTTEENSASGTYTYVKGGRFSKANVRKRNLAKQLPQDQPQLEVEEEPEEKDKSGRALVITAIALLLAIIGVVIYIAVRFLLPGAAPNTDQTNSTTTEASTAVTTESTELVIPCTKLELSSGVVEFDKAGAAELLDVRPVPADTTDVILYTSEDETVATVSANGKVTAVGAGQTVIVISCGDAKIECRVVCTMETEPTEETTQPTETQSSDFKLNRDDFSLFAVDETWKLYTGDVSQDEITWSSNDEAVAIVENGVVSAVAPGRAVITAVYQGAKYECVVYCKFTAVETDATDPTTGPQTPGDGQTYVICVNGEIKKGDEADVTLRIGQSFTLTLENENGETVPVAWSYDTNVCSVSGSTVTGIGKSALSKVSTFYNGVAYECIVRVY